MRETKRLTTAHETQLKQLVEFDAVLPEETKKLSAAFERKQRMLKAENHFYAQFLGIEREVLHPFCCQNS